MNSGSLVLRNECKQKDWEVYVDQSRSSIEKRASATLDAFIGLAPPSVEVKPAVFPKSKLKGPLVRCIAVNPSSLKPKSFDASNVDSVDKVFRILTKHMGEVRGLFFVTFVQLVDFESIQVRCLSVQLLHCRDTLLSQKVSTTVCDCLKWKYKGNGYLEAGQVDLAIDAYDKAIETGVSQQEGVVLLMRATAYLQRAAGHKEDLKEIVSELVEMVPATSSLRIVYEEAMRQPSLANAIFRKVLEDTERQEQQFRKTQYRHGLYQYALLQAAQDALRATQLLPNYATSWVRAGEILSELWKLKESAQYFERAIELDEALSSSLRPVIARLRKRQELLDTARAFGWSEDTLRLALDVAR